MPGGIEHTLARVCDELVRRGHRVVVFTPRSQSDWPTETDRNGVRIRRLEPSGGRWWGEARYLRRLQRAVFADEPQAVITLGLRTDAYAVLGAAGQRGVPVILQPERPGLAGDCHWQIEARCGARIKRRCYSAAGYAAMTPLLERELIAAGYPRPRIRPIPLGVPIGESTSLGARIEARRSLASADPALGVDTPGKLVVCVGRLRMGRGIDVLLRAWQQLVQRRTDALLWYVGEGPDAADLRERVFELGLLSSVRLTGAFDDVEDVFRAADVAVFPTLEDGLSVGLLEAASFSLPIVASDITTHREFVADGAEGRLYPKNDVDALAAALNEALADTVGSQLGEAARRRIAAEHSTGNMVDAYEQLLRDVSAKSSGRAAS